MNKAQLPLPTCFDSSWPSFREGLGVTLASKSARKARRREEVVALSSVPAETPPSDSGDPGWAFLERRRRAQSRRRDRLALSAAELASVRRLLVGSAFMHTRNSADAEDVVQSAFVRALEQAEVPGPDVDWRAWLTTVVRRLTIDLARRNRRWQRTRESELSLSQLRAPAVEPPPRWSQVTQAQVQRALERCDPRFRQVYELFYLQGMSQKEIARRLQIALPTVASRLHRAKGQIRRLIERSLEREGGGDHGSSLE
jgi:RNA polymerase sigma factor (sigma-70 family)